MKQKDYISLVDRSKQLSYEYYVLAQPTVSDAQFDALVAEIEQAEAEYPEWTLADSPTQMVGSDVDPKSGRRLIRHRTRMLSCQKAQTQEAVEKWITKTEKAIAKKFGGDSISYVLEWKYDGISCSLVYQDGLLISAATRGDKDRGQDLLAHVKLMPSVPQSINIKGRVEVRGEIVCPKAELSRLGYKDCRTAAAALCNQMVPSQEVKRLVFIAWQMDADTEPMATESMSIVAAQVHRFLGEYRQCNADGIFGILDEFAAQRETLSYPTDGVVIKIDEKFVAQSLGCTEHHPKGSIAYKFSAQKTITRVTSIEISIGEKGGRTPVAHLVPVMIMGREVSAASLYSERIWKELGVTEGCLVEVGLTNDVTPKIYRVIKDPTLSHIIVDAGNQRVQEEQADVVAEVAAEVGSEGTTVSEDLKLDLNQDAVEGADADTSAEVVEPVSPVCEAEETVVVAEETIIVAEESVLVDASTSTPSQRERNAECRRRRMEQRERQRMDYEARLEREAREAEDAARSEEHRKIFAMVGTVVVMAVMVYFFGLLGPAVFGLLAGGLLKG